MDYLFKFWFYKEKVQRILLTLIMGCICMTPLVSAQTSAFLTHSLVLASSIKCSYCGNENLVDAKFCSNCGKSLEKAVANFCPYCGKKLKIRAAKFCPHCGKKLVVERTKYKEEYYEPQYKNEYYRHEFEIERPSLGYWIQAGGFTLGFGSFGGGIKFSISPNLFWGVGVEFGGGEIALGGYSKGSFDFWAIPLMGIWGPYVGTSLKNRFRWGIGIWGSLGQATVIATMEYWDDYYEEWITHKTSMEAFYGGIGPMLHLSYGPIYFIPMLCITSGGVMFGGTLGLHTW